MKSLVKKVVNKLIKKKLTISIAESCTGGLLSSHFTQIPKASETYTFGVITYSNESKNKFLKISKKFLLKYGSVSKQTCILMAKNLNKLTKTDISISITGIAGPSGGSSNKPIGLVYVGTKFKKKLICKKLLIKNKSRNYIQSQAVKKTLKLISNFI